MVGHWWWGGRPEYVTSAASCTALAQLFQQVQPHVAVKASWGAPCQLIALMQGTVYVGAVICRTQSEGGGW